MSDMIYKVCSIIRNVYVKYNYVIFLPDMLCIYEKYVVLSAMYMSTIP